AAGFDVQLANFGYTRSHQVAVDVKKQGGGRDCAEKLEANDIICNYNLLPHDDPKAVMKPSGLRLGVQEKYSFDHPNGDEAPTKRVKKPGAIEPDLAGY